MHARPRSAAGTRASSAALKRASRHQQSTSNRPQAAGAQPFGPPQSGQRSLGSGTLGGQGVGNGSVIAQRYQRVGLGGTPSHAARVIGKSMPRGWPPRVPSMRARRWSAPSCA